MLKNSPYTCIINGIKELSIKYNSINWFKFLEEKEARLSNSPITSNGPFSVSFFDNSELKLEKRKKYNNLASSYEIEPLVILQVLRMFKICRISPCVDETS